MQYARIDETHHISRYCKPSSIDKEKQLPLASAFKLREGEEYLSVNWLEYFEAEDLNQAIDFVRQAFRDKNYSVKHNGRFALLRVKEVKNMILGLRYLPSKNDPSHSGIFGYTASDRLIALKIAELVRTEDVYPAKLPSDI